MVQSATSTSCLTWVPTPIVNSLPYQLLSTACVEITALAGRIARFVASIFTAICAFVMSCGCPDAEAFDASYYQQEYARCFASRDQQARGRVGDLNWQIYQGTMRDIEEQRRFDPAKFQEMIRGTRHISLEEAAQIRRAPEAPIYETEIVFDNRSTFDVAADMIARGLRPLALNMANENHVGGNPRRATAQEEELCRASALLAGLKVYSRGHDDYPVPIQGGVLTPQVPVFRYGPERGYAYRDPFYVDVIASAAYICIPRQSNRPADDQAYEAGTKEKMRLQCRVAIQNGNDSLLLGAFGCGAFQNPPEAIARWYADVLNEDEFRGVFKNITFGIIDRGSTRNFEVFRSQFALF